MFTKLLNFFRGFLYSESAFYIKKIDSLNYFVRAKNGLNAEINVTDRVMFVKAWSDIDYVAFYYCTPMRPAIQSIEHFVIDNIKQSAMFSLPAALLRGYVDNHRDFFERFSTSEFPVLNLGAIPRMNNLLEDNDNTHDYIKLNGTHYPIVYFQKKKVIKNIFRYKLKSLKRKNKETIQKNSYFIVDTLIYFEKLSLFYDKLTTYTAEPEIPSRNQLHSSYYQSREKIVGTENQLFEHNAIVKKHLNLDKVLVPVTENKEFCLFDKKNKKLTLSYILRPPIGITRVKNLVTLSYTNGQINKQIKSIIPDVLKEHEMAISNEVMDKFTTLKLTHPSDSIIRSLSNLNISTKLPLSVDDLTVLDMFNI